MIKNIIFNWAGTLVNDFLPNYAAVMNVFEEIGLNPISFKEFKREFTVPVVDFYKKYDSNPDMEKAHKLFLKEIKEVGEPQLFPDAKRVLEYLQNKGINMAVLTAHPQEKLEQEVKDYNIYKYFIDIRGSAHNKEKTILPKSIHKKNPIVESKNKAELSLSLKGDKQKASVIGLKIKNLDEIKKEQIIKEMLQKVTDFAEENKAVTYESQDYLFFIFAPIITKTFKNEKKAVEVAEEIKKILTERNRILRKKVEFGISLNDGEIIAKKERGILKFMSFGNLIISTKKISSVSNEEVYLTKEIKERLMSDVKTEKKEVQGLEVYALKEIKHRTEEHKKFISGFIKRLEKNKD